MLFVFFAAFLFLRFKTQFVVLSVCFLCFPATPSLFEIRRVRAETREGGHQSWGVAASSRNEFRMSADFARLRPRRMFLTTQMVRDHFVSALTVSTCQRARMHPSTNQPRRPSVWERVGHPKGRAIFKCGEGPRPAPKATLCAPFPLVAPRTTTCAECEAASCCATIDQASSAATRRATETPTMAPSPSGPFLPPTPAHCAVPLPGAHRGFLAP